MERRPYNTGLIAAMLTALSAAVLTGIFLLPAYKVGIGTAHTSVASIAGSGLLGFIRSLHHWSSAALIILGELYIVVGLFRGAYRKPGQWLWVGSILMFLVGVGMQLTGHLLPFDQQAVRTAVVETGIAANAPIIGDAQGNFLRGGQAVGQGTLHLWYLAHIAVFSVLCVILLIAISRFAKKLNLSLNRRVWILSIVGILIVIAAALQPPLGYAANSIDMTYQGARPEWYILPLHSLLVIAQNMKPDAAFIGTMVIPGLAILLLLVLPWIHKREDVIVARSLGSAFALALIGLYLYSFHEVAPVVGDQIGTQAIIVDAGNPGTLDPKLIADGKQLFADQGCSDCHRINGNGGKTGPDLTNEGQKKRSLSWQEQHLLDPKSASPGSTMPSFSKLSDKQRQALAQYLNSLGK